jgi:hypothetical protein
MTKITIPLFVTIIFCVLFLSGCFLMENVREVSSEEKYLSDMWYCDNSSELSRYLERMSFSIESYYGSRLCKFYAPNDTMVATYPSDFRWDFDKSNSILTITDKISGWDIILRANFSIELTPKQMITYYINSSGNPPFNAELFDNVVWRMGPYSK